MSKRRLGMAAVFVVVLLAVLLLVAQPGGGYLGEGMSRIRGIASGAPSTPVTDLKDVRQLSAAFNRGRRAPAAGAVPLTDMSHLLRRRPLGADRRS